MDTQEVSIVLVYWPPVYSRPGAQKSAILSRTRERTGVFQVWANMSSHFKNWHKKSAKNSKRALKRTDQSPVPF